MNITNRDFASFEKNKVLKSVQQPNKKTKNLGVDYCKNLIYHSPHILATCFSRIDFGVGADLFIVGAKLF